MKKTRVDWKRTIEGIVTKNFKGVTIRWNGEDPTLVIPDELEKDARTIAEFVTALWPAYGEQPVFHMDQMVKTEQR